MNLNQKVQKHLTEFSLAFTQLSNTSKGAGLAVASTACYGLSFAMTKGALDSVSPFTLLTIQTASGVAFLWIAMHWQGIQISRWWSVLKAGCIGLLEPGLSYIFIMQGLTLTTASSATFINATEPAITIALAWLILREQINAAKILLTLLACVGVVLIASPHAAVGSQGSLLGDSLVFLGVIFAALYAIATYHSIRSIKSFAPLVIAVAQQSIALIFFIIITIGASVFQIEPINVMGITWKELMLAAVAGALGYGFAFWLYLCALRYQSASESSLYLSLVPVFGAIGAYLLLGERLSLHQGIGGTIILAAVTSLSRLSCKS